MISSQLASWSTFHTYHLQFTERNIRRSLQFYRIEFPDARIPPKIHMLEEHMVPWIRRWEIGTWFHSEQGAESIHAVFNSLKQTHCSIRNPLDSLRRVMVEHYLRNSPQNILSDLPSKGESESMRTAQLPSEFTIL